LNGRGRSRMPKGKENGWEKQKDAPVAGGVLWELNF